MNNSTQKRTARRGRIFPEHTIPPEELARRKAEREAFYQRCLATYRQISPKLISNYYDWFIVIEPDSGDYFIDTDEVVAAQNARQKYPNSKLGTFRLNETGACGMI